MTHEINPVVRFSVDRRVTMTMCVLGVLVLGWLSLTRLPLEFLPTFSSQHISVDAPYPSSSPEETERLIVRPIESILGTINGIEEIDATATSESGRVSVGFFDGTNMDLAAVEVRDRIDRIRGELPDDLERVRIRRFQSTDIPILRFHVSAPWDQDRLYRFVDEEVRHRLERLQDVANVDIHGLRTREIHVSLIPNRLAASGVSVRDVAALIRNNNVNVSGGPIREGSTKYMVRIVGEFQTLDEIRALPLNARGLRLGDIADVSFAYPEREEYNYLNGREAMSIGINKASTGNLLAVVDRVKAELARIQELPEAEGFAVNYFHDASKDVRQGLAELRNTGLLGGGLAILFIFLFLRRVRTTLLVAIAIPLSVVVTFVILYLLRQAGWSDLTINVISLTGLMLAIGMLVDNSIVVIENVFRHRQELGEDARTAVLRGASEVALPIAASTLTTICVFLPLVFVATGRFGNFMRNIGTTIVVVMVASLVVSLTVVPMAGAILLKGESSKRLAIFDHTSSAYGSILRFTLRHRLAFSLVILGLLVSSWVLYQNIGRSFSSFSFARQLTIQMDVPRSYSIEQKQALFGEVYDLLDSRRKELEIANISYSFRVGSGRSRRYSRSNRMELYLVDDRESKLDTAEIRDRVEGLLPVRPGVKYTIGRSRHGPRGEGSGVSVELSGDRPEILELLTRRVVRELAKLPALRDVDSSLESGDDEVRVRPDRERTLQAGLSTQMVGASIAGALSTRPASYLESDERELNVVVQYREEDRRSLDQLGKLPVAFGASPLPINAVADFKLEAGPGYIEREDRRAIVRISTDMATGMSPAIARAGVQEALGNIEFPMGYDWQLGRESRESMEDAASALFTLLFAQLLVYMIIAALFESFAQPFTIMFSIPFAFIGVGLVMWLTGQEIGSSSYMGLIILAGIVVNNAIVLIHHINQLRRQGLSRDEAIIAGGQHRLRPILMTAATTILGLSPMVAPYFLPQVFGAVEGRAAYWSPVGLVILGGLTTSTFLTVLVIPTLYSLVDDFTMFLKRVVHAA